MIHKENLIAALSIAIAAQRKIEKGWGYTSDSGLVGGWVENKKALENNEKLEIKY